MYVYIFINRYVCFVYSVVSSVSCVIGVNNVMLS